MLLSMRAQAARSSADVWAVVAHPAAANSRTRDAKGKDLVAMIGYLQGTGIAPGTEGRHR